MSFYTLDDLTRSPDLAHSLSPPARVAVIGDPIGHSKSPQMHNPGLLARGIDAQYVRVQVPVGRVAEALQLFAEQGFLGVNVTIPHKFEALAAVDKVDPLARTLGAVNTIAIRQDGRLQGYNSDGPGYLRSVREGFGEEIKNLRVMVLGAGGGAGRAVAVQSALEGCQKLVLVNRTAAKAQALRDELLSNPDVKTQRQDITVIDWTDDALRAALSSIDLIVNGTSLGMKPTDAPLLPAGVLLPQHRVFDMVYRVGEPTALGLAAQKAGSRYLDGATLLLHQGAISFEHWFGNPVPLEAMRAGLAEALTP